MKNLSRAVEITGLAIATFALASPAFAQAAPVDVPEPATMTILAVAAAGTIIAGRLFRRK